MNKETVAIVIPCRNSMPFIKFAVESIFTSTQHQFKLLLIESESTDGTAEYCDKLKICHQNVEVYHIPLNGMTNALNYGIKKAGNLDVYLTQDDVIHFKMLGRDWLDELSMGSKRENIGQVTTIAGYGESTKEYYDKLKWVGTWSNYISRRTINKIGLFDENMSTGNDVDYSYRTFKAGMGIGVIDYWVQHHRLTKHGNVDDEETKVRMARYFRKKHKLI